MHWDADIECYRYSSIIGLLHHGLDMVLVLFVDAREKIALYPMRFQEYGTFQIIVPFFTYGVIVVITKMDEIECLYLIQGILIYESSIGLKHHTVISFVLLDQCKQSIEILI
jgi:hypothetical protein